MSRHLERGLLLYGQRNYAAAEKELRLAISLDPNDSYARALLASSLIVQNKEMEALNESEAAIELDPSDPFAHYVRSTIQMNRGNLDEALISIEEAIRLQPYQESFYANLADIYYCKDKLPESLEAAETGLSLDPEQIDCINARARVLIRNGRGPEAEGSLLSALERDPGDAITHTNLGWVKLRLGQIEESMNHFKEGLRIEPTSEWAREGVVEGLKSRNPIYYVFLKFTLWFSELDNRIRVALILGLIFLSPFRGLLLLILLLVWFSDQLFNTILRFDNYGRIVLTDEQISSSNFFIGASVVVVSLVFFAVFNPAMKNSPEPPRDINAAIDSLVLVKVAKKDKLDARLDEIYTQIYLSEGDQNFDGELAMAHLLTEVKSLKLEDRRVLRAILGVDYFRVENGNEKLAQVSLKKALKDREVDKIPKPLLFRLYTLLGRAEYKLDHYDKAAEYFDLAAPMRDVALEGDKDGSVVLFDGWRKQLTESNQLFET